MRGPERQEPRVFVGRGARATEASLLDEVERLAEAARRDPSRLVRPVRLIVPSRSLREHLCAALVRRRGASLAGVVVQTLRAAAFEILHRGERARRVANSCFP